MTESQYTFIAGIVFGAVMFLALHSFFQWLHSHQSMWAWQTAGFALLALSAALQVEGNVYSVPGIQGPSWRAKASDVLDGLCVIALTGYMINLVRHFQIKVRGSSVFILLASVQALLCLALILSDDAVFSNLSSFLVPAVVAGLMAAGLVQLSQIQYSKRLAVGFIFLILFARGIYALIVNFSLSDSASIPVFISIEFTFILIVIAGLVWWSCADTAHHRVHCKIDLENILTRQSVVVEKNMCRDISGDEVLSEALQNKNVHQARIMAYVSHDLRAPLATIAGCVKLLHDVGTPDQQKQVRAIERNIAYQRNLVDQLFEYGRGEIGFILTPVALNLPLLIDDLSLHATTMAASQGNQTIFEIAEVLPSWVLMDGNRLSQVLLNLLSNAANFTRHGVITLRIDGQRNETGWRLQFSISDTGIGIALEDQARVFESFQQAKPSMGGSGLGLHIARRIVESMGGRLTLASEVGKGSTFTFAVDVPVAVEPPGSDRNFSALAVSPSAAITSSQVGEGGRNQEPLTLPSIESLDQLALFAGNGQWSAIDEWIVTTEATQPSCHAFVARIRLLFGELDFPGIQHVALGRAHQPDGSADRKFEE